MPQVIRVGDSEADLVEALTHLSATPPSPARTRWVDAVLDDLLELRDGTESLR